MDQDQPKTCHCGPDCHCDQDGQCHCDHKKCDHDCREKIAKLERISNEHLEGWKRAKADYLNLKRDSEKERKEIAMFARGAAVIEFLPIYDNLKRAIKHVPAEQQQQEWAKGLNHIQRQFEEAMKAMGIEPIATEGQPFDHNLHHAVRKVKVDGMKSDVVVEELKSGFKIGDKVLEPAQVTVSE